MLQSELPSITGPVVEIGSGATGFLNTIKDTIKTDIEKHNWLDCIADSQNMPFKDNSIPAIIMIDVLHHIEKPTFFFEEATRVLKHGGRIILIDPYPTALSLPFYKFLHDEPMILSQTLENYIAPNQAISHILWNKKRQSVSNTLPNELSLIKKLPFSTVLYPLSGGYKRYSLLPEGLIRILENFENIIKPLNPLLAFRIFITLEKKHDKHR